MMHHRHHKMSRKGHTELIIGSSEANSKQEAKKTFDALKGTFLKEFSNHYEGMLEHLTKKHCVRMLWIFEIMWKYSEHMFEMIWKLVRKLFESLFESMSNNMLKHFENIWNEMESIFETCENSLAHLEHFLKTRHHLGASFPPKKESRNSWKTFWKQIGSNSKRFWKHVLKACWKQFKTTLIRYWSNFKPAENVWIHIVNILKIFSNNDFLTCL